MKRILVLSGGGVKGTIQLKPLIQLEESIGKPIHKQFDLIVGSSVGAITGGILATGLLTASEYSLLFLDLVQDIFYRPWWRFTLPKYRREVFLDAVDKHFGFITLSVCKTKFMCTSVNLCDNRTHFFKSWEKKDGNLTFKKAIARSFAAPYYFGMMVDDIDKSLWIDGGCGVSNCPLDIAFVETKRQQWEDIEFTVIGTGRSDNSIPYEVGKKMWFSNLRQILSYVNLSDGGLARSQSTDNKIRRMQFVASADKNISLKYYDIRIKEKYDKMDKVKYLNDYLNFGQEIINTQMKGA